MIIKMSRIRILGPRAELQPLLEAVQDLGLVHFVSSRATEQLGELSLTPEQERQVQSVKRIRDDLGVALQLLHGSASRPQQASTKLDLPAAARISRRTRRELESIEERRRALLEERALIRKFEPFFSAFKRILASGVQLEGVRIFYLVVREAGPQGLSKLRTSLRSALTHGFELISQPAPKAEAAVLLVVAAADVEQAETLLSEAGVNALAMPEEYAEDGGRATIERMQVRLSAIPRAITEVERERRRIANERSAELARHLFVVSDHLARIKTMEQAAVTPRAFVTEGWIPTAAMPDLQARLQKAFGDRVAIEVVSSEEWAGDPAPVVLSNPRLFKPFEAITRMMPLPRYGTIDPTPFVAVLFPMFFGVALGDIAYGLLLGVIALYLRIRSETNTTRRAVSEIGLACALFTVIFGFLYGEFLGDIGHKFGLRPIIFSREEAIIPFLCLALAIGLVHIVLGFCLGAINTFRGERRKSIGRGLAAVMVILVAMAIMAAAGFLPKSFFSPIVIALLVAFPVLVALEGIVAPVEFISTMGNILSYARIMALGTASVMMAVVANRMAGAFGGVVVGALFALLFHLVNFVIGVFGPTIHMLRLHYVEFFGKFFSPGGIQYRPLKHWSPREDAV